MEEIIKERAIDNEFITELIKAEPSFEVLSFLLKQGANINAITQKNGYNCLMDILHTIPQIKKDYKPKQEVVKFLIDNGAEINHCDPEGFSVVHCLDIYSIYDELLFKRGANLNIINRYYGTPLDMVQQHLDYSIEGTQEINIRILKSYGGKSSVRLRTENIRYYLFFIPNADRQYCFMSVDGFLDPGYIPGLDHEEFEGLISSYRIISEKNRKNIEDNEIWDIETNKEEVGEIIAYNEKLLVLTKNIRNALDVKTKIYMAYFDISHFGAFHSELFVEPDTEIKEYQFQNPLNSDDCF